MSLSTHSRVWLSSWWRFFFFISSWRALRWSWYLSCLMLLLCPCKKHPVSPSDFHPQAAETSSQVCPLVLSRLQTQLPQPHTPQSCSVTLSWTSSCLSIYLHCKAPCWIQDSRCSFMATKLIWTIMFLNLLFPVEPSVWSPFAAAGTHWRLVCQHVQSASIMLHSSKCQGGLSPPRESEPTIMVLLVVSRWLWPPLHLDGAGVLQMLTVTSHFPLLSP